MIDVHSIKCKRQKKEISVMTKHLLLSLFPRFPVLLSGGSQYVSINITFALFQKQSVFPRQMLVDVLSSFYPEVDPI